MEGEKNFEVGSSSTRTKVFPAGLRVLVVDDDPTCLIIIETMLRTCHYEVVAAGQAVVALKFLRDREGGFDLVLTDVHMPDMDGFQLLHCIRREFSDIPVIMMSVDNKFEVMSKGLESGACFYLVKPITFSEIQTLWEYVFHMRSDNNQRQQEGKRKAKESEEEEEENEDKDDSTSQKKVRMAWNADLHQQFLDAIEQLGGFDNAVPVRILKLMGVPGLTREQIASHLQKYRIFVRRNRGTSTPAVHGNPRYSQSPNLMPLQQGIRDSVQGIYASNCMPLAGPAQFLNQGNLQQPWLSNPPLNQQNVSSYTTLEMEQYDTRMGEPLHGDHDNSAVFVRANETMQTVHQQTDQASLRPLGNGPNAPVDHNFSILNLPGENNALVGGNTGIGMESFGNESSNCNNLTYNQMDEVHVGNMKVAATRDDSPVLDFNGLDFDYTTQGMGSSSVFPSENQSPTMFTNVIEQLKQPPSLPPPDLQQQQGEEDVDHFMDMLMSMCTHANEHNLLPQNFVEGNLGNSIFNEIDEATYQQQQEGNEQVMDPKFDGSRAYQLDDDDSSK